MDPKLLLVKLVTLLYKESLLPNVPSSGDLVREIVQSIKMPDAGVDFDRSRDTMVSLRGTVLWMCESINEGFNLSSLLQRIRVNTGEDEGIYYAVEQGLPKPGSFDPDELKKEIIEIHRELRAFQNQEKATEVIKKASTTLMFNGDTVDWRTFVADLYSQLEPFLTVSKEKPEGLIAELDVNDIEGTAEILKQAGDEISLDGILPVPWQGMRRMLGDHQGIRRGETVVLGALQHQHKSGVARGMLMAPCLYVNKPWMLDPNKKPLILHISTEDDITKNILDLYKALKENETGEFCDIRAWLNIEDPEHQAEMIREAARYISAQMTSRGYNFKMMRFNPSELTFRGYFDLIQKLEAEGYEIHLVVLDYLAMMSKKGCDEGPTGANIRDLWRRMRNFHTARSIAFISPHQLSTEAKALYRGGIEDFVKEIANKGYYDGCRTLDQEVDLEIYFHIVIMNGKSYLTMQRGKHRKVNQTPQADLYTVLQFFDIGGLRHDINGADTSLKRPGEDLMGGAGNNEWLF